MGWRIGNLVHTIVVEEDKRTSRRSENGIPAAPQYCPRVITLDALPAVQFNRKRLEWPARRQRIKDFLKMVYGHFSTFPFFSTLRSLRFVAHSQSSTTRSHAHYIKKKFATTVSAHCFCYTFLRSSERGSFGSRSAGFSPLFVAPRSSEERAKARTTTVT
jgi:hypothetical protein